MFIKFDGNNTETVVECKKYRVRMYSEDVKEIVLDDEMSGWLLQDHEDTGHWRMAFVMNNDGKTIEKIYGPVPAGTAQVTNH